MIFLQADPTGLVIFLIVILVILVVAALSIKIVPQSNAYVIERLGTYLTTWGTGPHFLIPGIYRISRKVTLKEQVIDWQPQAVITKDNVTMQIDTVIFFTITDPKQYTYGVDNAVAALEKLTATTLRNIVGDIELDQTLTSRDMINTKMRVILDEATDRWGIRVDRVELKNILPPKDIRDAMEKQMRAERERRETILRAEGEKTAAILTAEGFKASQILQAEAKRQVLIEEAEGNKRAAILKSEGEALAIIKVQEATAKGLELIKGVQADSPLLTLKAYEALGEMARGQSTKIIVPSNLQGLAGLATSLVEITKDSKDK
jgi:regulator of protease activity HflC (stomatin/prohibitin superfamily)